MSRLKYIVITSISAPTQAVESFSRLPEYQLIVAGDRKSPDNWQHDDVVFLSASQQMELGYPLQEKLPWNHYCRKMMGYIYAIRAGAEVIVDTDDDNIPYDSWEFPSFDGEFNTISSEGNFYNIYSKFTDRKVWPRGYPLELINQTDKITESMQKSRVGVWQGLADDDPDVDAIYRLVFAELFKFNKHAPVVLSPGLYCPYNSQNTATRKELFPLLYLPATVTFRFTDILRGIVAQPVMNAAGFSLGFTEASVYQERNVHNLLADFVSEIPCYTRIQEVVSRAENATRASDSVSDNLFNSYEALYQANVVQERELQILTTWLKSF